MTAALRCNHDIKFLGRSANASLSVLYYLTNYISKNGISSYNAMLYAKMAFEKSKKYEIADNDKTKEDLKLLNTINNAAANYTEYSAQQVGNMLQENGNDGTFYSSHDTENLNLYTLLQYIKNVQNSTTSNERLIGINVTEFDVEKTLNQVIYDYLYRDEMLRDVSLYKYISDYKKVRRYKKN